MYNINQFDSVFNQVQAWFPIPRFNNTNTTDTN